MWLDDEFNGVVFGDKRLVKRFKQIMQEFMKKAQSNIASTFDSWSSIKGCYRFFSNDKVESQIILDAHIDSTISRISEETNQVFVIHDTTYIDYKNRKKTLDLDCITRNLQSKNIAKGLILHNSFAVNDLGVPLGIVGQNYTERKEIIEAPRKTKKHLIHNKPVEEKESYRWVEAIKGFLKLDNVTQREIVHIADREGDFYELYRECCEHEAKFLIRASQNRAINKTKRREASKDKIFDYFRSLKPEATITTEIQINKEKKHRKAKLCVAFKKFTLPPPPNRTANKDGKKLYNMDLYGVIILEKKPPKNHEPLEWLLITNIPVTNTQEAIEKMRWYSLRWNVETFHKILKSGCSIEGAQLRSKKNLIKYITTKSVIAWRIFWLSRISRIDLNYNCNTVLTKIQQDVLFKRFNKGKINTEPISVKQALNWIGKLGGYIGRNSDAPPGIITIWKGWTRLMNMVDDYTIICG